MIGGMPESRLEFHFWNWERWMKRDSVTDGYPGKAAGCIGGGYSQSFDDMVDAADVRCARILDALVGSLTPIERAAISHKYLYAVFRHGRDGAERQTFLELALIRARLKVAEWLVARGVY